jgi:hypothetical protein
MSFKITVALVIPLLALTPSPELPVDDWIERSQSMESLVLEFEILSTAGEMKNLRFVYEAPETCYTTVDDEPTSWIDGDTMIVKRVTEAGFDFCSLDLAKLSESSNRWLRDVQEQLPRESGFIVS